MSLSAYKLILFSYCTVVFSTCSSSIVEDAPQQANSADTINIRFDTLRIYSWGKITGNAGGGGKLSQSFIWKDSSYMASSCCKDSAIAIFNLNDANNVRIVKAPSGFDVCNKYSGLYFINPDKFYLLQYRKNLMLYENKQWNEVFSVDASIKKDGLCISEVLAPGELFVQGDSILYLKTMLDPDNKGTYSNYTDNYPVTAAINVRSGKAEYPGIGYPGKLRLGRYAFLRNIYQQFCNERIFYYFKAIPEIWEYAPEEKTIIKHKARSRYQSEEIKPISGKDFYDKDGQMKHMMRNGYYDKFFLYDPDRKLYYRFFNLSLAEKNAQGYFNGYSDTRIALMVLDEKFNILSEQLLPQKCYFIYYASVTKDGLCINYGPLINPEKNGFPLLKISVTVN